MKSKIEGDAKGEVGRKEVFLGEKLVEGMEVGMNGKEVEEGQKVWKLKVIKGEEKDAAKLKVNMAEMLLIYNSKLEDRLWAAGGMVAKVVL